ncbi:MAG: YlbF family regulator [Bacilli bacterium]|nr:YlbF family regulator [Bacilli bacterium]
MELLKEVLQLKDILKKEEIIDVVHQNEKKMLDDEYTQGLIFKYQQAMSLYNDAIRYHLDIDKYQKELSKAKEELYSSPLVKVYLDSLKKANEYLQQIKEELFESVIDFDKKKKTCNL